MIPSVDFQNVDGIPKNDYDNDGITKHTKKTPDLPAGSTLTGGL